MMQIQVKVLRGALKACAAVVERRTTVPILSHVHVRSTPGQMTVKATDLDLMVEKAVDLEDAGANRAMDFCVDAALLAGIAAKLPVDGIAAIAAEGNTAIAVTCGRARFRLPVLPSDDFPVIATGDWDAQWEADAGGLTAMFDSVDFAMSDDDTRYYLKGVYLHVPDGAASQFAAATDGHRLARYHVDVPDGAADMPAIILPAKAVKALGGLLDEAGGRVDVAVSATKFRFAVGQTVLTGKVIDGTFPDYTRVIPAANRIDAWFDPAALAEAVERVLTISSDRTRVIAMEFAGDTVTLRVTSPEHGTASEDVPIDLTGDGLTIGFNGRYLLDILGHLKGTVPQGTKARVLLGEPETPSLWQQSDDAQRLYVLMPMRV